MSVCKVKGHPYDPKTFKLDLQNTIEGFVKDKVRLPFRISTKMPDQTGLLGTAQTMVEMIVIDFYLITERRDDQVAFAKTYYIPCNFVTEIF